MHDWRNLLILINLRVFVLDVDSKTVSIHL
jgi:hypothetical protein